MFRRHFFLLAALGVLALMLIVGAVKVLTRPAGGSGPASTALASSASSARAGPGAAGRRGGFGGPTQVTAVAVQSRMFEDTLEVLGVAKGRKSVTLTAAATQLVQRVHFKDGQFVSRGAVLVELKDTEQDAGAAQAQARLVQAQRAYERFKTLGEKGYASKAAIDQYEAAWRSAQADLAAAQARRNDRLIRAPFAGVVGLSDIAPGALVNPGAPIVTLDDLSGVRVDFPVPERAISQLHEGQTLLAVADAYPGETLQGRVARLDTRVDERTRAIMARAEFPNPGRRLKPGMMIRVGISRGQRQSASAPESAVSVQGESAFVYVIHQRGDRAMVEQRPVVTGLRQAGFVEIRDGVRPGEQLVADGLNKIQPGQPVRVAGPQGAGPKGGGPQGGRLLGAGRPPA